MPSCGPVSIESIEVYGTTQLIVGQRTSLGANVVLSDGHAIDVTSLVSWSSSAAEVLSVDAWGAIEALTAGDTNVVASLGDQSSAAHAIAVTPRPALLRIQLLNSYCDYPIGPPVYAGPFEPRPGGVPADDFWSPPICAQAVEIGGTIQFSAFGEFAGGYYEDISDEVEWLAAPTEVGDIAAGLFTGRGVGVAAVSARLGDVSSDTREVRVVAERSVVASRRVLQRLLRLLTPAADICPFFECGGGWLTTLLVGDSLQYRATARYDTGGWEDVTTAVDWHSTFAGIVGVAADGWVTAVGAGTAAVYASLGGVESNHAEVPASSPRRSVQSVGAYWRTPGPRHRKGRAGVLPRQRLLRPRLQPRGHR